MKARWRLASQKFGIHSVTGCAFIAVAVAGCNASEESIPSDGAPVTNLHLYAGVEFPEAFWRIQRVAELADSHKVLVHDAGEARLFVADFATGARTLAAAVGSGPLEYRSPGILLRGGADLAAYHDMGQRRILFFSGDGRPVETIRYVADSGAPRDSEILPVGLAPPRFIYGSHTARRRQQMADDDGNDLAQDSTLYLRVSLGSSDVDSLFYLRAATRFVRTRIDASGQPVIVLSPDDFRSPDVWTVLPDGRVASLRGGEYRVRFWSPDGTEVVGPVVRHERIPVTRDDRRRAVDSVAALAARLRGPSQAVVVRESRGFAEFHPVFQSIMASPDNRLWVGRRVADPDSGQRFDVLDDRGDLLARVRLPPGQRLVGLGRGRVYAVRHDPDGVAYLIRHELQPPLRP